MKLIIDTDPGVDDALAIAMAVAMSDVELVGLTTIFGNTFTHQSSRNARYLLDLYGGQCPVAPGAKLPYGTPTYQPASEVHGPEGLGAMTQVPDIGQDHPQSAAAYLVEMARAYPRALTVCAIGPLTNIADALQLDPEFATYLDRLVIMGGAFACPGNITPQAEANIFHDALAADAVFASDLDIVMVGLDATMRTLLTPNDFLTMAETAPRVGGFLHDIHDFYLGFYRSVGLMDGCPMHDATALLACTNPDRFTMQASGISVICNGDAIGKTIADPSRKPVQVAMNVEADWAVAQAMALVATYA